MKTKLYRVNGIYTTYKKQVKRDYIFIASITLFAICIILQVVRYLINI